MRRLRKELAYVTCRVQRIVLRLAIALPSLMLAAGLNLAAAQARLEAAYDATLLGLPIGHISWTAEFWGNRYTTTASGGLSGLLRIFSDAHGEAAAHGSLSGGQPAALHFALKLVAGKWSDDVRISFSDGKIKEYVATAAAKSDSNQVPLTDASRKGVVDPMTALFVHIPGAGEMIAPEACERTVAVFDGHTRYDLRLAFKRLDKVNTEIGYQGPVVVCSVKFFPVAGYDPKHFLITYLAAQKDTEIWLAPVAGSRLMVPYRMSMPTPMGLGILQATRFESLPARSFTTTTLN